MPAFRGTACSNVHDNGSFQANVIFIADNDATGELRRFGQRIGGS